MIDSAYVASRAASTIVVLIAVIFLAPVMREHWPIAITMLTLLMAEVVLWLAAFIHVYGGRSE